MNITIILTILMSLTVAKENFIPSASIGGYGELHWNKSFDSDQNMTKNTMDFHRFIIYTGYNFTPEWSFKSELEIEHNMIDGDGDYDGEVELEQAYVNYHSDLFGFQAGVIFAAGFILYNIIFGIKVGQSILSINMTKNLMAAGLLLYVFVGFLGILLGGNFLDYNTLSSNSVQGQLTGVFLIELGVGSTVSNVMILIFYSFNHIDKEQIWFLY